MGFDGDGDGRLKVSEKDLLRYLTASPVLTQLQPHIVKNAIQNKLKVPVESVAGGPVAGTLEKELENIQFELSFRVSHPTGLTQRIGQAVKRALRDSLAVFPPAKGKVMFSYKLPGSSERFSRI